MKKPAVFLDRDGTITVEGGYINHESRLRLIRRTSAAIKLLNEAGIPVFVVTNQAGVARGYFKEELINTVHDRLEELLAEDGARLDGIYYCPHHPDVGEGEYRQKCNCRKPATGMIERAVEEFGVDPEVSYMVGDKITDVEFGQSMGAKGIMVMTGYGLGELTYQKESWKTEPDYIAKDLFDAAIYILKDMGALLKLDFNGEGE